MHLSKGSFALIFAALACVAGKAAGQSDPLADARGALKANRVAEAESILHNYLAANGQSADAHFLLGYVLFREQKPEESLNEFTAGAKYRRPKADEFKVIASDYVMLGGYSDAERWFSEVVKEKPDDSESWYLLGRARYSESNFQQAIAAFDRALVLRPEYVEAENNLGLAWQELGDRIKAQEAFETAVRWQGDQPADAQPFLNLGALLTEAGQDGQALTYLSKAVALAPENPSVHEQLAKTYTRMEKLPQAETELETAVALAPSVSPLHFQLAQLYRKMGKTDRANQEFAICKQLSTTQSSGKTPNPFALHDPASKP
ncbi:MAG TPA: tetratricopeptide repeat protein [Terracidiphilus sp.]